MKQIAFICTAALFLSACSVTAPLTATGNSIGKKVGTAKANVILGLTFGGDYSIQTAAKNGGISKISTVDVKHTNVLFLFMSHQTIVTGE
ncbi:MAG TPA: TRL-like family protein [Bacteroidia bacterium]|nr:TRL-like family protein [Bacteroidia bacterium]